MKLVHPSLKKGRKSVFIVSLAQSKKPSKYHSELRSLPRPPVGLPSPSFPLSTQAPAPSHSLLVEKFAANLPPKVCCSPRPF